MKFLAFNVFLNLVLVLTVGAQGPLPGTLGAELDAYLRSQMANGFSGSVLVVRGGKEIIDRSYGGGANTGTEPKYWIASNSKSFVAAAILRLEEQGKLKVEDPVTKFFAGVPADKSGITLHHLLTHTSGLPHRYAADGIADRGKAVQALLENKLAKKVGEGYLYSNDGYNLLAAIVEAASGRTFEDYVGKELLGPAGLKYTGFWGREIPGEVAPVAKTATASSVGSAVYKDGRGVPNWGYHGATGLFSTAKDIHRWMAALRDGKVLRPTSVEKLWSKQAFIQPVPPNEEAWYGYGWSIRVRGGERLFVRHNGYEDWLGHSSVMALFDNGNAIVVMSNAGAKGDSSWASVIYREIHRRLAP